MPINNNESKSRTIRAYKQANQHADRRFHQRVNSIVFAISCYLLFVLSDVQFRKISVEGSTISLESIGSIQVNCSLQPALLTSWIQDVVTFGKRNIFLPEGRTVNFNQFLQPNLLPVYNTQKRWKYESTHFNISIAKRNQEQLAAIGTVGVLGVSNGTQSICVQLSQMSQTTQGNIAVTTDSILRVKVLSVKTLHLLETVVDYLHVMPTEMQPFVQCACCTVAKCATNPTKGNCNVAIFLAPSKNLYKSNACNTACNPGGNSCCTSNCSVTNTCPYLAYAFSSLGTASIAQRKYSRFNVKSPYGTLLTVNVSLDNGAWNTTTLFLNSGNVSEWGLAITGNQPTFDPNISIISDPFKQTWWVAPSNMNAKMEFNPNKEGFIQYYANCVQTMDYSSPFTTNFTYNITTCSSVCDDLLMSGTMTYSFPWTPLQINNWQTVQLNKPNWTFDFDTYPGYVLIDSNITVGSYSTYFWKTNVPFTFVYPSYDLSACYAESSTATIKCVINTNNQTGIRSLNVYDEALTLVRTVTFNCNNTNLCIMNFTIGSLGTQKRTIYTNIFHFCPYPYIFACTTYNLTYDSSGNGTYILDVYQPIVLNPFIPTTTSCISLFGTCWAIIGSGQIYLDWAIVIIDIMLILWLISLAFSKCFFGKWCKLNNILCCYCCMNDIQKEMVMKDMESAEGKASELRDAAKEMIAMPKTDGDNFKFRDDPEFNQIYLSTDEVKSKEKERMKKVIPDKPKFKNIRDRDIPWDKRGVVRNSKADESSMVYIDASDDDDKED